MKLVCRQSESLLVVCVYRPPGAVTPSFTDQLSDLLIQLLLLNAKLSPLVTSAYPATLPGQLDRHAVDVSEQYNLQQHVTSPTHVSGNTLNLILTQEEELSGLLVSDVVVESACFSDHQLLKCRLGVPLPRPVTATYTYRSLHKIDTAAFCHHILRSELFDSMIEDADVYTDLFDAEVKRVLDMHAPQRTGRRRCGQHDNRSL